MFFLFKALFAVNRFPKSRLKRDFAFFSAFIADGFIPPLVAETGSLAPFLGLPEFSRSGFSKQLLQ